jgi:hypothetical protein
MSTDLPRSRLFWVLFAVSILVAVAVALVSGEQLRYQDELDYMSLAQNLMQGHGYLSPEGRPTAYRPPGYPVWMAPWTALSHGVVVVKLLNVAMLGVALWLMRAMVGRRVPAVAWCAGAAALAYPVWVYTAATLYPQTLCLLLLMTVMWALDREAPLGWGACVALGVLNGVLALVAPSFLLLSPVIAACLAWRRSAQGQSWVSGVAVFGLCMLLVLAPWTWRNWQVFGAFVPIATNGGINLALGNCELTGPNTGTNLPIQYFIDHIPPGSDEVQESHALQAMARDWAMAHPADAITLYVAKFINYFNFRAGLAVEGGQSTAKDLVMLVTYYPLLALVGWRLWWRKRVPMTRGEWMMLGIYLCNGLLAAIFFTRIRFRLPFDALLMTLALISLGHLSNWWRTRRAA